MKYLADSPYLLYLITFAVSLAVAFVATPLMRLIAVKFDILDHPHTNIKTHRTPTPYLGGVAIWLGWTASLFAIRFFTHFPTGTLNSLRGMLWGSVAIIGLGLIDDILPKGMGFKNKFLFQFIAALGLFLFNIQIHFISPYIAALVLSTIWVVGITNSFNIIDIMDGLSSGIAVVASLAFLFIALPTEQIYVNFSAAALAGGCLGFMPYNFSKKYKIFMGDTGSLMIGFILAAISMGTSYTKINDAGLLAPLLILAIPIYDTILVMIIRLRKGKSPFLGSKDHFALRLEAMGFSRKRILVVTYSASAALALGAFLITRLPLAWSIGILALIVAAALKVSHKLTKIEMK
ncbi:MAG TPA: hypothetical protein DEE98_03285 [Elusimicrobia bacterium]|nr:MAG: hypothetical protein A2278_08100 [Elusimicrobia bacterium RIFOXYA12_FULL_49_49]OGS09945.1 MAG: hypothetical protein A2204_02605 [Elusimicrobia bacterium RIFOXYA1_FULL_47_7]OGS11279.1 MAG: hypothetical protein A2386_02110 [Elusimicrobia bacterium RIFOXYB1_FULL_48_9]OGS15974.1 MAG: hypothetical protein A2251_02165 [Elusimicrobia bacterium RIFOXYA2_FULL_47_53]OGS26346.1 MAG: hypothetical protein A2339_03100 [Elusimicrobia bacterium RIFOXYB12_FULL_50_12]OGS29142.1 MAG: hypothetical protein